MPKRIEMTVEGAAALYKRNPKLFESVYGKYITAIVALNQALQATADLEVVLNAGSEFQRYKSLVRTHIETAKLWCHAYGDALDESFQGEFLAELDATYKKTVARLL